MKAKNGAVYSGSAVGAGSNFPALSGAAGRLTVKRVPMPTLE